MSETKKIRFFAVPGDALGLKYVIATLKPPDLEHLFYVRTDRVLPLKVDVSKMVDYLWEGAAGKEIPHLRFPDGTARVHRSIMPPIFVAAPPGVALDELKQLRDGPCFVSMSAPLVPPPVLIGENDSPNERMFVFHNAEWFLAGIEAAKRAAECLARGRDLLVADAILTMDVPVLLYRLDDLDAVNAGLDLEELPSRVTRLRTPRNIRRIAAAIAVQVAEQTRFFAHDGECKVRQSTSLETKSISLAGLTAFVEEALGLNSPSSPQSKDSAKSGVDPEHQVIAEIRQAVEAVDLITSSTFGGLIGSHQHWTDNTDFMGALGRVYFHRRDWTAEDLRRLFNQLAMLDFGRSPDGQLTREVLNLMLKTHLTPSNSRQVRGLMENYMEGYLASLDVAATNDSN